MPTRVQLVLCSIPRTPAAPNAPLDTIVVMSMPRYCAPRDSRASPDPWSQFNVQLTVIAWQGPPPRRHAASAPREHISRSRAPLKLIHPVCLVLPNPSAPANGPPQPNARHRANPELTKPPNALRKPIACARTVC
jgi:hypothetical protein